MQCRCGTCIKPIKMCSSSTGTQTYRNSLANAAWNQPQLNACNLHDSTSGGGAAMQTAVLQLEIMFSNAHKRI